MKRSLAIWRDGALCLPRVAPRLCPPWLGFEVRNPITRHRRFPEAGRPPLPSVLGRSIPGLMRKDSSFPLCLQMRPGRRASLPLRPWAGLGSVTGPSAPGMSPLSGREGLGWEIRFPGDCPLGLAPLGTTAISPQGWREGPSGVCLCAPHGGPVCPVPTWAPRAGLLALPRWPRETALTPAQPSLPPGDAGQSGPRSVKWKSAHPCVHGRPFRSEPWMSTHRLTRAGTRLPGEGPPQQPARRVPSVRARVCVCVRVRTCVHVREHR